MAKALAGQRWEVGSAGTDPAEEVHPMAVRVMEEIGIDLRGQRPKKLETQALREADLVVTLCAEAEGCLVGPPGVRRLHWPLPDPAQVQGSEEEVLGAFRQVREAIGMRLRELLSEESLG